MTEILKQVDGLAAEKDAFMEAIKPEAVDAKVKHLMERFDIDYSGVLAPTVKGQMRAEHERSIRQQIDAELRTQGATFQANHRGTTAGLATVIAALQTPPREPNPQIDATREVAALQRYHGRRLADLTKVYQSTSDTDNATLINLIESDLDAFKLREDRETDVAARGQLKALIETRRTARVPAEIQAADAKARGLLSSVSVQGILSHLKSGRGFAAVATAPRPLKLVSNE